MRYCLYLGTGGCPPTLEDALDNYHDQLAIHVPTDPRLLGVLGEDLEDGFGDVARVIAEKARQRAHRIARRETEALADVFGQSPPDPGERITSSVLEGRLSEGLDEVIVQHDVDEVYVARHVLEIFDGTGIRIEGVLDRHDVDLVAR